jgi:hypothetical protein
MSEANMGSS